MFREEKLEKVILSREEYIWYQQRRKECKVYDPNDQPYQFAFKKKKAYYRR
jgi:hypothetical protein